MLRDLPEIEFGQQIEFREYSLFENPLMPAEVSASSNNNVSCVSSFTFGHWLKYIPSLWWILQVKESWLDVQLCQDGSQGCGLTNGTGPLGVLKFPKSSSEEKVLQIALRFKMILFLLLRTFDMLHEFFLFESLLNTLGSLNLIVCVFTQTARVSNSQENKKME